MKPLSTTRRFGRLPPEGPSHALVFLPMGLVAALGVLAFWMRAKSPRQRRGVAIGYVVACPVAFLSSLLGGLVLPGVFGPLVYGAVPLLAGSLAGFALTRPRAAS